MKEKNINFNEYDCKAQYKKKIYKYELHACITVNEGHQFDVQRQRAGRDASMIGKFPLQKISPRKIWIINDFNEPASRDNVVDFLSARHALTFGQLQNTHTSQA